MTATGLGSSSIWQPSQSPGDEYALLMKFRSPCPGDRGGSLGLPPCDPAKSGNAMCWITKILPDGSCLRCQSIIDGTKLQAEREGRPLGHTGIAKIAGHAVVTLNRIVASASRNRSPAARRRRIRRRAAGLLLRLADATILLRVTTAWPAILAIPVWPSGRPSRSAWSLVPSMMLWHRRHEPSGRILVIQHIAFPDFAGSHGGSPSEPPRSPGQGDRNFIKRAYSSPGLWEGCHMEEDPRPVAV